MKDDSVRTARIVARLRAELKAKQKKANADVGGNAPTIRGLDGQGVKPGGLAGQVLVKLSDRDFDTVWVTLSGGAIVLPGTDLDGGSAPSVGPYTYTVDGGDATSTAPFGSEFDGGGA